MAVKLRDKKITIYKGQTVDTGGLMPDLHYVPIHYGRLCDPAEGSIGSFSLKSRSAVGEQTVWHWSYGTAAIFSCLADGVGRKLPVGAAGAVF